MKREELESEANYFAMCLLMPEDMVREEVKKMQVDLGSNDFIKDLAKKFEVPVTAMAIRLSQLRIFKP